MIRRTPLRRSRKPLQASKMKSPAERWRVASEKDKAKIRAEKARVYGAEYGSEFLRLVFRARGCAICGRFRPPGHQAHVRNGGMGRKGMAEETAVICYVCHRKAHDLGIPQWLASNGLPAEHLDMVAAELAAEGRAAGYLPVELCEQCGSWHSAKFMLWEFMLWEIPTGIPIEPLRQGGRGESITSERDNLKRICAACAPEGPP